MALNVEAVTVATAPTAWGLAQAEYEPRGELAQPYQVQQLRLDLYDESIVLTRYAEGIPISSYEVSPEDVAAAFAGAPMSTGLLPPGCVFYTRRGGRERIGVYLPPQVRALTVTAKGEHTTFQVPLPGFIFTGWGSEYNIYAVSEYPARQLAMLYHAPVSNVYENGRICTGDVSFPACASDTVHQAVGLFFESNFNFDLSNGKSRKYDCVVEMWRDLDKARAQEYPLDDLFRSGTVNGLWAAME